MARGGSLPIITGLILVISVVCAIVFHLWRPVFISTALFGLIAVLVRTGNGAGIRMFGDFCGEVATRIGKAASWIILGLIALIMTDVITRKIEIIKVANAEITSTYGFSVSFILQDFQWHLHGVLLLMTFGFGYMLNAHVRVDIFREMASRRTQAWIEAIGLTILAIPFMLVMIGFSWDLTYASWKIDEASESMVGLGWRYIIKSFLMWGFTVALMAVLATLIRCILFLYGDYEEQAVAEDDLQFFTDNDSLPKLILENNEGTEAEGGR